MRHTGNILFDADGWPDCRLKIARGVYVREEEVSTPAGPVRLTLRLRDGVLDDFILAGPAHPRIRECLRQTVSGPLRLTVRLRGEQIDALAVSPGRWHERARAVEGSRLDAEALRGQVGEADDGRELIEALLEVAEFSPVRSRS